MIGRSPWALALLGYSLARSGEPAKAFEIIEELKVTSKRSFVSTACFALIYTGLTEKDQAFEWLEKACKERQSRLAYLKVEALWDPLRTDPRFAELLQRAGLCRPPDNLLARDESSSSFDEKKQQFHRDIRT